MIANALWQSSAKRGAAVHRRSAGAGWDRFGVRRSLDRTTPGGHRCPPVIELPPETTHREHETIRVTPTAKDFKIVGFAVGAIIGTPQSEASASSDHGRARMVCGAHIGKSEGAATKRPVTESAEAAGAD